MLTCQNQEKMSQKLRDRLHGTKQGNEPGDTENLILNTTCHELRTPEKERTPTLNVSRIGISFDISPLGPTLIWPPPLNHPLPEPAVNTIQYITPTVLVYRFYSTIAYPV